MKTLLSKFHDWFIYDRRMSQLSMWITTIINMFHINEILDIGAGDGKIDSILIEKNNVHITGIDVLVRDKTFIPVTEYDGRTIPYHTNEVNTTMMIDVLHHADDPEKLFSEVVRVTDEYIILKDHTLHGWWSLIKLKMMDYVGNKQYNVSLPYNYLTEEQWNKMFEDNNLEIVYYANQLDLYTFLCHIFFDSNLHFIALLKKKGTD